MSSASLRTGLEKYQESAETARQLPTPTPGGIPSLLQLVPLDRPVCMADVGSSPVDGPPLYQPMIDALPTKLIGFDPNPAARAELQAHAKSDELVLADALDLFAEAMGVAPLLVNGDPRRGMDQILDCGPVYVRNFFDLTAWVSANIARLAHRLPSRTARSMSSITCSAS